MESERTHGGRRPAAGRRAGGRNRVVKSAKFKKMRYQTMLPGWVVEWLRRQGRPSSQLIETALVERFNLTPPDGPERVQVDFGDTVSPMGGSDQE